MSERDVLLPIGIAPVEEPDEILACLRYVAGFTPALVLNSGGTETGDFDVSATEPDASFYVEIGADVTVATGGRGSDFVLEGRAVDLLEALSFTSCSGADSGGPWARAADTEWCRAGRAHPTVVSG